MKALTTVKFRQTFWGYSTLAWTALDAHELPAGGTLLPPMAQQLETHFTWRTR